MLGVLPTYHSNAAYGDGPDMAKTSPHVLCPELFAIHLGSHIVNKYAHIKKAFVDIEQLRWQRIRVDGQDHPHSFWRDGDDKRTVSVEVDGTAGNDKMVARVASGISDLLVIKTTDSAFENFVRDEYTTLAEVDDRIFSTSVDVVYTYAPLAIKQDKLEDVYGFQGVAESARKITLDLFATDNSASVQATLFKMGQKVIGENASVTEVSYSLPNKHYIPVDMRYIGVENTAPASAEVFTPVAAPSGLITATITRS